MVDKKITAVLIVEIAGKPAEHVKESIIKHVENLKNFKNITLVKYTAHEPKEIKLEGMKENDLFSTFAEVEIQAENFISLMDLVFEFMPSSMEIIEPFNMDLSLEEGTMILNRLAGRLHRYDEIARAATINTEAVQAEFSQIMQKLKEKKEEFDRKAKEEKEKEEVFKKKRDNFEDATKVIDYEENDEDEDDEDDEDEDDEEKI